MSHQQNLLDILRNLDVNGALPETLKAALGDLRWSERIASIENISPNKTRVLFYSDNLNLDSKSAIEKIILKHAASFTDAIVVNFSKKNKTAPQKPKEEHVHGENCKHDHHHAEQPAKPARQPSQKRSIPGVDRIIAVASGKGGVGKSTVSVNLALALYNQGYRVGILDADIYGPSVPTMLNVHTDPLVNENNKIVPPEAYGLKIMSFGFFAPEETAVIWRGPMIMKALQQFFWDVEWGKLDFLIIDLPPGTGDAQLTLVQSIPISGSVIVTTPQNVALLDAVKGIALFEKTEVPILGIVENMSTFTCPSCNEETFIFGQGGAERVSGKFSIPILGHVPLVPEIRVASDIGEPLTSIKGHGIRTRFAEIAEKVVQNCV